MAYLTIAAYVAAYFTLIVWLVVLSAGYSGQSNVLDISSWQDCRKLIRGGWMIFGSSYMFIASAIVLNQAYFEEQWGWIYVSGVIFYMGLLIGPVIVMSGKRNNPHVPS
jgi:hypothetical protein